MPKVSVLITARNEPFLPRMLHDLSEKLTGDYEILVAFDGPPYVQLEERPSWRWWYRSQEGLKPQINYLAAQATGEYLLKFDAHCSVSEGIDEILSSEMEWNWIVTPRFYVLNAEEWKWQDDRFYDYFYLSCPLTDTRQYRFQAGGHWRERTLERVNGPTLDETMQIHGSGWFVGRDYFLNSLGGMSSIGYDTFGMEPPELCLKTWLGPWGGRVMVNKRAWYAHMHKGGQRPRGYPLSDRRIWNSYDWCARYWMTNQWAEREHDLGWLVDRFMPIPNWPANWRELQKKWEQT